MYRLGPGVSTTSKNFFNIVNFERLGRRGEGSEIFGKWFYFRKICCTVFFKTVCLLQGFAALMQNYKLAEKPLENTFFL